MATKDTLPSVLREAREFLGPDFEFVMEGITGLGLDQALFVLDGLRPVFGWTQDIHVSFVEHLSNGMLEMRSRN